MFYQGYDTDDLTDRQNFIFRTMLADQNVKDTLIPYSFISNCVKQNISLDRYDNYVGDCEIIYKWYEKDKGSPDNKYVKYVKMLEAAKRA